MNNNGNILWKKFERELETNHKKKRVFLILMGVFVQKLAFTKVNFLPWEWFSFMGTEIQNKVIIDKHIIVNFLCLELFNLMVNDLCALIEKFKRD